MVYYSYNRIGYKGGRLILCERRMMPMTVFEALSLMIAFATLVLLLNKKK